MSFCFRVKAQFKTVLKLSEELEFVKLPGMSAIEIRHEKANKISCVQDTDTHCPDREYPRVTGETYTFICRNFESKDDAQTAGSQFYDALNLCGAVNSLGIDFATGKPTGSFSNIARKAIEKEIGCELMSDQYGLMVYEEGKIKIVGMSVRGYTSVRISPFEDHLTKSLAEIQFLNARHKNCTNLINAAAYSLRSEAQLILYVSAVEALCEDKRVGKEYENIIGKLVDYVDKMKGQGSDGAPADAWESVERVLFWARKTSIRQSYLHLIRSRLDNDRAKRFDELYRLRSEYLHVGIRGDEMAQSAGEARIIAVDLLKADLAAAKNER